ncbi:Protein W02B12.13 a, partial [Aphelenchoides avenae]
ENGQLEDAVEAPEEPFPFGVPNGDGTGRSSKIVVDHSKWQASNNWGFARSDKDDFADITEPTPRPTLPTTTRPFPLPSHRQLPEERNGLLAGVGQIDVGLGVGVKAIPHNDPISVGGRVGVGFGASGLAGGVPIGFPFQGERYSLNDYNGNKDDIVPDRALKYYQAQQRALAVAQGQELDDRQTATLPPEHPPKRPFFSHV